MDYQERLGKILEQVAWYGSYLGSGEKPEGPTLSPQEATKSLTTLLEDATRERAISELENLHDTHFWEHEGERGGCGVIHDQIDRLKTEDK